ncbi:hypothetical protein [Eubacterium aggregans]|uniref:hypothetical protein n=1 Tax=Eubacterium aggregans TaxID=81409 RepID=UPI003F38353A
MKLSITGSTIQTGIFRIDTSTQMITQVGDLKAARNNPVVSYTDRGDVYVAAGTDANGNLV